jgi:hypothetical protein
VARQIAGRIGSVSEQLPAAMGQDRVMFGRFRLRGGYDWPNGLPHGGGYGRR